MTNPKATDEQYQKVVVKSFYQDTDIYYDSLNRELAALDSLTQVPGVHNYVTAYGNAFAEEEGEAKCETPFDALLSTTEEGELHIVSEYILHGDLFDFIMNCPNGQVAPLNVVHIGKQLVDTLHGVHQQGWLHLDVKPENVCVTDLGQVRNKDLKSHNTFDPTVRPVSTIGNH